MQKIKITNQKIAELLEIQTPEFPKYATQIINLASQNSQATRPKAVGQLSDLIQEFEGNNFEEWEKWYLEKYPNTIKEATKKVVDMLQKLKDVMDKIDEEMVEKWVKDLIFAKTFSGLKFQEAILKTLANKFEKKYRLANKEEEAQGIDGFIGETPVSIKPTSYDAKKALSESIDVMIIQYEKKKDGLWIYFEESIA